MAKQKKTRAYDPMMERTSEQTDQTLVTYICEELAANGIQISEPKLARIIEAIAIGGAWDETDALLNRASRAEFKASSIKARYPVRLANGRTIKTTVPTDD